ncbi:PVC-type heme-binding CxxCH protein [Paludisphaera sp.]|uniref:PVC-type heme-binding CxxCH protein n=1 Tax=Paludisphaera sp. TaxID=2017432 RepID=UPI00301C0412
MLSMRWGIEVALGLLVSLGAALGAHPSARGGEPAGADEAPTGPLAPEAAAKSFRVAPGVRVELVAAEPLVVSPVACAFDERGRMFVAEDRGYPTGPGEGQPPIGRIALLDDRDGDGRMDHRVEFAEGLTYPNGVLPWDGGVIVTCSPDVLWLKDTDGDGKADVREVLFTGFSTKGSTQLRVSHPVLSIDGWIYLTSGLTGGSVTAPDRPDHPAVTLGRTDFRFRPDRTAFEAADGGAQFGQTFDDFGRRFICYNRVQVQHVVISSSSLRRNPRLAFSETVHNCPADMTPEPLRGHGSAARIFPISRNVTTADSHAGTFTAACAVTVFRGDGLPDEYRGGAFSCDPTGNLVHFDRLEQAGATFAARAAREGVEFLASTDDWFRPVFLGQGPEGALYICDMYRKTIEHPDYLPEEIRKRTDFEGGKTMGRIWRAVRDDLSPDDARKLRRVDLRESTTADLCRMLADPNAWRRDAAHRLLLERRDAAAAGPLAAILGDADSPGYAIAAALGLLDALDGLDAEMLRRASAHPSAGAREIALRLIGDRLKSDPSLIEAVLARADDDDPRVRFQAAITLGDAPDAPVDRVVAALASIAARDGADRWARAAVFSSLRDREIPLLEALRGLADGGRSFSPELLVELGRMASQSAPRDEWPALTGRVVTPRDGRAFAPRDQAALLTGLAESVRGRLKADDGDDSLRALAGDDPALAAAVDSVVKDTAGLAADASASLDERRAAIGFLGFAGFDRGGDTLLEFVGSESPPALQAAAVRALGIQRDPRVAAALLGSDRFGRYTPTIRDEVMSVLLSQGAHIPGVLDALADGRVPVGAVDALHRRQLAQNADETIRRRAAELFGPVAGDRAKVYDAHKDVVAMTPDPSKGRAVFLRECAQCHRLDQEGVAVGPDLFDIRNQSKEAILLHILAPDHEITPGFTAYTVATLDGRVLTGLIASETDSSITLRQSLGKEDVVLRSDIDEVSASKQSLMPQGLEETISRQEFADLLSYLKGEGAGGE